jgi:hypothetical protein
MVLVLLRKIDDYAIALIVILAPFTFHVPNADSRVACLLLASLPLVFGRRPRQEKVERMNDDAGRTEAARNKLLRMKFSLWVTNNYMEYGAFLSTPIF